LNLGSRVKTLAVGERKIGAAGGAFEQGVQVEVAGVTQRALFGECDSDTHGNW